MIIQSYNPEAGYNASAIHRNAEGFKSQYTAYNKGYGPRCEVLTVRIYGGRKGTSAMVFANILPGVIGTTGSAFVKWGDSREVIQVAMEAAGFSFAENFISGRGTTENEVVQQAATAMGYPNCHIFEAFP